VRKTKISAHSNQFIRCALNRALIRQSTPLTSALCARWIARSTTAVILWSIILCFTGRYWKLEWKPFTMVRKELWNETRSDSVAQCSPQGLRLSVVVSRCGSKWGSLSNTLRYSNRTFICLCTYPLPGIRWGFELYKFHSHTPHKGHLK